MKKKIISVEIDENTLESTFDMDGTIPEVVVRLKEIQKELEGKGFHNIRLVQQYIGDEASWIEIHALREETDKEYQDLKSEARWTNINLCTAESMSVVDRVNGWTAYENSYNKFCSYRGGMGCSPILCLPSIILAIILLVVGLIFLKKHLRNR